MGVYRPPYGTPQTDLPLALSGLPGGKSARNAFYAPAVQALLRKNAPRDVHAAAADCNQGEISP